MLNLEGHAVFLVLNPSSRSSFLLLIGVEEEEETARISYRYSMIPWKRFFSTTATQSLVLKRDILWLLHSFGMTQPDQINGGPP